MLDDPKKQEETEEKQGLFSKLKEIAYGISAHHMSRYALRTRAACNTCSS